MSDSGDSDVGYVPYPERAEWQDITPVPENDGPKPVVVIAHSEKFKDVYDYFRAVLQLNEKSERVLNLTKEAVGLNPANYTVWQYRRDVLKALGSDVQQELDYVESIIKHSPKNYQEQMIWLFDIALPRVRLQQFGQYNSYWWTQYLEDLRIACMKARRQYARSRRRRQRDLVIEGQLHASYREAKNLLKYAVKSAKDAANMEIKEIVDPWGWPHYTVWHHRRVLVEWAQDPSQELQLTSDALLQDPKNYHAWQHRQWAIKTFGLYNKEMEFVDSLLTDDVRNNSAWNQRYFVMNNHLGWSDLNVQKEICYTIEKIKFVKNNESAWNYLKGILLHDKRGVNGNAVVTGFCEELYKNKCRSPYLLAFIIDICDEAIKKSETNGFHNADRAVELCQALASKYDKIRCKYWNYICEKFKKIQAETPKETDNLIDN